MWEASKPGSETEGLFLRADRMDYYEVEPDPIPVEWMPNVCSPLHSRGFQFGPPLTIIQYRVIRTDLIEGTVVGTSFTTVCIDTPIYLSYLLARFLAKGGVITRSGVYILGDNHLTRAAVRILGVPQAGRNLSHGFDTRRLHLLGKTELTLRCSTDVQVVEGVG